jgi:hypothetical protein
MKDILEIGSLNKLKNVNFCLYFMLKYMSCFFECLGLLDPDYVYVVSVKSQW